jgi:hypothetical protein
MFPRARTLHLEWETTAMAPTMLALAATAVYARAVPFKSSLPFELQPSIALMTVAG